MLPKCFQWSYTTVDDSAESVNLVAAGGGMLGSISNSEPDGPLAGEEDAQNSCSKLSVFFPGASYGGCCLAETRTTDVHLLPPSPPPPPHHHPPPPEELTRVSRRYPLLCILGLGFGMPMARKYADYFGGSLEVMSIDGYGTDVYLRLRNLSPESDDHRLA